MVKLAVDLHMHSCLSPCADMDMTPNNIVNMAYINGLDMIAVADHNSALNLPAIKHAANERGILLLPAIEAETREEVHMLCYMPSVSAALELSAILREGLPDMPNISNFFGEQAILDQNDEKTGIEPRLLLQATSFSIDELAALCRKYNGVPVPAHINRTSNSLLNNLGFIPPAPAFTSVEIYQNLPVPNYVHTERYHVLHSSDAHNLYDIFEQTSFITLEERSVEAALKYLASPNI